MQSYHSLEAYLTDIITLPAIPYRTDLKDAPLTPSQLFHSTKAGLRDRAAQHQGKVEEPLSEQQSKHGCLQEGLAIGASSTPAMRSAAQPKAETRGAGSVANKMMASSNLPYSPPPTSAASADA